VSGPHPATAARATAGEIAAAVRGRAVTAAAVVDAALARAVVAQPKLAPSPSPASRRGRARPQSTPWWRPAATRPLAGVPFAVKNLFDVAGLQTLAGSKIEADSPAAADDSPLIARLEAAGAVLVGALGMGEYAYDFSGRNSHYGATRNPHDPARMTGGSSGGSGGAVAAGIVPLALGSDTNGSIRVPSSLCGTFGLKPTFGRLTRRGSFPWPPSTIWGRWRARPPTALAYDAMQAGPERSRLRRPARRTRSRGGATFPAAHRRARRPFPGVRGRRRLGGSGGPPRARHRHGWPAPAARGPPPT
jgi:aspartyl-tRNA(Asn)/glutamyl-tRNA(Gln) amidotransferase subunit A